MEKDQNANGNSSPATSPSTPKTPIGIPNLSRANTGFDEAGLRESGLSFLPTRTATTESFPGPKHVVSFRSIDDEARGTHGYPKLAQFIGNDLAVYRRFATANARILLYRQAEITHLEHELGDLEQQYKSNPRLHQSVHQLIHSPPGSEGHRLWSKFEELDRAVNKYNRLLLEQKKLYDLPAPDPSEVNEIWNFIHEPVDNDDDEPWLKPPENSMYIVDDKSRESIQLDLVKLNSRFKNQDPFTKWFTGPFLYWFYERVICRFSSKAKMAGWDAKADTLERTVSVIVIMIASILPAVSIVALFYISKAIYRLIFILLFSAVFSVCMAVFSNADRAGIFTASLALAGVQAVFVGSTLGSNGTVVGG